MTEDDQTAEMVLRLVRELVTGHKRAIAGGLEPTCMPVYDHTYRDFVNKRSDMRGPAADSPKHNRRAGDQQPQRSHRT